MKDIKNYIIALLTGLLVLTVSMQNSNGATSTVTTAQFKALQARVIVLEKNSASQPSYGSKEIKYIMADSGSAICPDNVQQARIDLPILNTSPIYRFAVCTLTVLVP